MKKTIILITAALFASLALAGCQKKNTQELRVYSIIHDEETEALTKLFTENVSE